MEVTTAKASGLSKLARAAVKLPGDGVTFCEEVTVCGRGVGPRLTLLSYGEFRDSTTGDDGILLICSAS
jgi:hypothetical protein